MKKILYISLLISQLSFSQEEREVGNFNKVTSFDKIDVTLIQAEENKVVLNGNDSESVEIVNKNGELKIRMPFLKLMSGDNISATVYFKNISAVEANEGSRISSDENFEAISFDIIAKEGAIVKLKLNVDRATIKSASGGIIEVSGNATNQEVVLGSGGILRASDLKTKQTIITVNAGGEGEVFASDLVDAKVRAGGNILIYGKPKQINKNVIVGGKIQMVEDLMEHSNKKYLKTN